MTYHILLQPTQVDLYEQRSRFIGIGHPVTSPEQFKTILQDVKAEYHDATHVTYAWRMLDGDQVNARFFDDGEPAGTAGKPILNHLEGQQLVQTAIFVVRYFGGIKLGTGGLTRAYGQTAKLLLLSAPIGPLIAYSQLHLAVPYEHERQVQYQLQKFGGRILKQEFTDTMTMDIQIPTDMKAAFLAALPFRVD